MSIISCSVAIRLSPHYFLWTLFAFSPANLFYFISQLSSLSFFQYSISLLCISHIRNISFSCHFLSISCLFIFFAGFVAYHLSTYLWPNLAMIMGGNLPGVGRIDCFPCPGLFDMIQLTELESYVINNKHRKQSKGGASTSTLSSGTEKVKKNQKKLLQEIKKQSQEQEDEQVALDTNEEQNQNHRFLHQATTQATKALAIAEEQLRQQRQQKHPDVEEQGRKGKGQSIMPMNLFASSFRLWLLSVPALFSLNVLHPNLNFLRWHFVFSVFSHSFSRF